MTFEFLYSDSKVGIAHLAKDTDSVAGIFVLVAEKLVNIVNNEKIMVNKFIVLTPCGKAPLIKECLTSKILQTVLKIGEAIFKYRKANKKIAV